MNSSELNEAFRSGLGADVSRLFSDHDVWRFADDAYRSFVRLIGGIPDFTSIHTQVALTTGQSISTLDPLILRILHMSKASDNREVKLANFTDIGTSTQSDYGRMTPLVMDDRLGEVRFAVIGMEKNKVRWISVPEVDDTVNMQIYRLPVTRITKDGQDLSEIEEQHHMALLMRMNSLAFASPLVGNPGNAAGFAAAFSDYCATVRREMGRYKAKVRIVKYGGLP